MDPPTRRKRAATVLTVVLGPIVVLAACLVGYRATVDVLQRVRRSQLQAMTRLAAERMRENLENVTEHLTQVALGRWMAKDATPEAWRNEADEVRGAHGRVVRFVMLVDESGRVIWMSPAAPWPSAREVAASHVVARALASQVLSFGAPVRDPEGSQLVFMATAAQAPYGPAGKTGGLLVAGLDIDALSRGLLDVLATESSGVALLVSGDGGVTGAAGEYSAGSPQNLQAVVPGAAQESLRRSLRAGASIQTTVTMAAGGRTESGLLVSEPIRVADVAWSLAVLVPRSTTVDQVRPLLFAGGLLLLVVFAGATAGGAALAREWRIGSQLRGDLQRLQRQIEGAERERRGRFLAEEGREPSVYLRDLRVVSANLAAVRALEAGEMADLHGRSFHDFVVEDERSRVERFLVGRVAGANVPEQFQARLVTGQGGRRLVEMFTSLVEREGTVLEHVTWRDVTSRERAEALLRAVTSSAPVALVLCDSDGNMTWANAGFAEKTLRQPERFLGRPLLPLLVPADRRRASAMFGHAVRGDSTRGTLRLVRPENEPLLLEVQAVPVGVAGELFGVLFSVVDITQRARDVAQRERGRRGEVLGALGASVAHRLNNELQALLGLAEGLRSNERLGAVRDSIAERVASAAESLQRFVLAARSGTASLQPLRLKPLVARWLQRVEATVPGAVRLTSRLDVPDDHVIADAAQLEMFLDLAFGAAAADLAAGGGAIEVAVEPGTERETVRLALSDTAGVEEEVCLDAVGEVGPEMLTPRGLAGVFAEVLAQRHEGSHGGRRRPGIGTRLWIELPLRRATTVTAPAPVAAARPGTILVADDEEMVRASLAAVLRDAGYQVAEAGDGGAVVEEVIADPGRFALVVLDLVMPVLDGRQVLQRLRERCPELTVLVCTGYDPSGDAALASAHVLVKPFSLDDFLSRVRRLLGDVAEGPGESGTMTQ
jgi:PAS domain S-box-containing protein